MRINFYTILPVEECQQRLNQAFSGERKMGVVLSVSEPVWGKVRGQRFHMHRKPNYGNIFFPFLFGVLLSRPKGTLVRSSVHFPLASVLLAIFFLLLGFLFQLNNLFTQFPERSFFSWLIYLWPLFVFGSLCVIVVGVGLVINIRDSAFLEHYLRTLLGASDEYGE